VELTEKLKQHSRKPSTDVVLSAEGGGRERSPSVEGVERGTVEQRLSQLREISAPPVPSDLSGSPKLPPKRHTSRLMAEPTLASLNDAPLPLVATDSVPAVGDARPFIDISGACLRVLLLMITEKLKGDSDLKGDMPLTTVPTTRLQLLVRSGVLLGKTLGKFSPGLFDTLCLRTKGGEVAWNMNLRHVWDACPYLTAELRDALVGGSSQAAWQALRLVVVASLALRARSTCKPWLGTSAETWPLLRVLYAWVYKQNDVDWKWEDKREVDVEKPSAAFILNSLQSSGAVRLTRTTESPDATTLQQALAGSALEGAVTGPDAEDDCQLELIILWACTSVLQKTKARGSVIRPLGSDTSWIAKGDRNK
jgi:hypothetical protein